MTRIITFSNDILYQDKPLMYHSCTLKVLTWQCINQNYIYLQKHTNTICSLEWIGKLGAKTKTCWVTRFQSRWPPLRDIGSSTVPTCPLAWGASDDSGHHAGRRGRRGRRSWRGDGSSILDLDGEEGLHVGLGISLGVWCPGGCYTLGSLPLFWTVASTPDIFSGVLRPAHCSQWLDVRRSLRLVRQAFAEVSHSPQRAGWTGGSKGCISALRWGLGGCRCARSIRRRGSSVISSLVGDHSRFSKPAHPVPNRARSVEQLWGFACKHCKDTEQSVKRRKPALPEPQPEKYRGKKVTSADDGCLHGEKNSHGRRILFTFSCGWYGIFSLKLQSLEGGGRDGRLQSYTEQGP